MSPGTAFILALAAVVFRISFSLADMVEAWIEGLEDGGAEELVEQWPSSA